MTSLVVLTEAEAALVGGGAITQTISISVSQWDIATVSQTAFATNSGRVSARTAEVSVIATGVGAESGNAAAVLQVNVADALSVLRVCSL